MKDAGLRGVSRVKAPTTTRRGSAPDARPDLVDREFTATAPNQLWVADITYIRTFAGWVYASFVLDVFSRRIVGWQLSTNLYTGLALDALNMGIWTRQHAGADLTALIHHSDRGVQYTAVRYSERLADVEAVASIGSVGDSYDNAMAEALNSLFKAELVRNKGPWHGINDLEIAVAEYVDWYNRRVGSRMGRGSAAAGSQDARRGRSWFNCRSSSWLCRWPAPRRAPARAGSGSREVCDALRRFALPRPYRTEEEEDRDGRRRRYWSGPA